jgi:hypothetical protein
MGKQRTKLKKMEFTANSHICVDGGFENLTKQDLSNPSKNRQPDFYPDIKFGLRGMCVVLNFFS